MNWIIFLEIIYVVFLVLVCIRIIYDTKNVSKTLAYLLLVIFVPVVGAFFYLSFGINYRKNKLYTKKIIEDKQQEKRILEFLSNVNRTTETTTNINPLFILHSRMVFNTDQTPLTGHNDVQLLFNGEVKFPAVLSALRQAKHHIHIEYYIYEDDEIGKAIEDILIQKAHEGVEVRFIYDDFGSFSIRKTLAKRLRKNGVNVFPFYRIRLLALANRLNYRNHRKIIVIDGLVSFVGGINISDKYTNDCRNNKIFWRDTHLKITGPATALLQHIFIGDWNFCSQKKLAVNRHYFPDYQSIPRSGDKVAQIVASGPDSDRPSIYYSIVKAIQSAKKEVLLTTPYFIPGETIMDALIIASLSGVKVKLLVPGISDSFFVNAASKSYYTDLLKAGVEVYLYTKGFVHAKTLVADRSFSIIGTANLDHRSFDLNFEVNAAIYDDAIAAELVQQFEHDLTTAEQLNIEHWLARSRFTQLLERIIRLVSPML